MFDYDFCKIDAYIYSALQSRLTDDQMNWLNSKVELLRIGCEPKHFQAAFGIIPRRISKKVVLLSEAEKRSLDLLYKGLSIDGWELSRLVRCWFIMQLQEKDVATYHQYIDNLFATADMNEAAALYSSLPLLAFPDSWIQRCMEGVRSNLGVVLSAIICNNPYPAKYLPEAAWNQLVLKAFFTNQEIEHIYGLEIRKNQALSDSLYDYVKERNAAGRSIHPTIWECMAPYIDAEQQKELKHATL